VGPLSLMRVTKRDEMALEGLGGEKEGKGSFRLVNTATSTSHDTTNKDYLVVESYAVQNIDLISSH